MADVLAVADTCDTGSFHYLAVSLGANIGWDLRRRRRIASTRSRRSVRSRGEREVSEEFADLLRQDPHALAEAMSQMREMPEWALDQQRRIDPEAQFATFQAWPDLSPVPAELRVPSHRRSQLVSLDGADHMTSFLNEKARRRRARHT